MTTFLILTASIVFLLTTQSLTVWGIFKILVKLNVDGIGDFFENKAKKVEKEATKNIEKTSAEIKKIKRLRELTEEEVEHFGNRLLKEANNLKDLYEVEGIFPKNEE